MTVTERIYALCKEQRKKVKDVCEVLGIQTSTMSTWRSRGNNPPAEYLEQIASFLGVSIHYLVTGRELPKPKYTTPEQDEILELFAMLPENKKYEFIGELKGFIKAMGENAKYADAEKRYYA
ncbi:MAG: helix-turn-helix domain-containing protein [Lachnospiraceae bacterium]|nr:helix-turn-helix domain-containing protein [Lachnospiraceae bacterium]